MSTQREILENLFKTEAGEGLSMLEQLCAHGIVSPTYLRNIQIVQRVEQLEKSGVRKTDAVYRASDEFRLSTRKVYQAIRRMNE